MRWSKLLVFIASIGIVILRLPSLSFQQQEELTCARIPNAKRPALLFRDKLSNTDARLCIAYASEGEPRKETVLSVNLAKKSSAITQLDNAIFLLKIEENCQGKTYVMDLDSGTIRNIADSRNIVCLRSEPKRKRAMLIDFDLKKEDVQFLELDLASLNIVNRRMLPRALLGKHGYASPGHNFKISPDFARIARSDRGNSQLDLLDIDTQKITILDNNVIVNVPLISSADPDPPFEWITNNEILYQHMPGGVTFKEGLYAFKIIDINAGTSLEIFRKTLPVSLGGGSFEMHPLNNRLIYEAKYLVDTDKKILVDKNFPYSVTSEWQNNFPPRDQALSGARLTRDEKTEIRLASELIYGGNTLCNATWLSGSGKYLAYILIPDDSPEAGSYAIFRPNSKPLKIGKGRYNNEIIGWIE